MATLVPYGDQTVSLPTEDEDRVCDFCGDAADLKDRYTGLLFCRHCSDGAKNLTPLGDLME